jgi:hypothetical protein
MGDGMQDGTAVGASLDVEVGDVLGCNDGMMNGAIDGASVG